MKDDTHHSILVVDDSTDDIELTKIALTAAMPEVRVASAFDGKTALEMLRGNMPLPSLILIDVKMPGMSGLDTLQEIRRDDRLKRIPVVMVTCSSLESDRDRSLAAGADGFLPKAFSIEQFSNDLKTILCQYLPSRIQ
jgi:CheY-like chemotaxis protein